MYLKLEIKKEDNIKNILPKRKTKNMISMNLSWKEQIGKNIIKIVYKNPKTKKEEIYINKLLKKIMELKPKILEKNETKEKFDY